MEIYKRKVGYEDLNYRVINNSLPITASSYLVTATTLYFPFMLTQDVEDIGIYTDTENKVYEIFDFSGVWNLSNTGVGQSPCLTLNNCTVNFTSTPITFFNANNGSISASILGCPGPQTLKWTGPAGFTNTTNLTINSLASGNYTLKVTDANCNITYASYFLTQPQSLSALLQSTNSQTNVTSPGGCNGTAGILPSGGQPPYTYTWYSITTAATTVIAGPSTAITGLTSLCAGQYNVQIQDASNTIVSQMFFISEPTPISGSVITTTNIDCNGANTGSLTVRASGGLIPNGYTYVLSGPTTGTITGTTGNATFNNLLAGTYTVQIFDGVGNTTIVGPINITQPISSVGLSLTTSNLYVSPGVYNIGCSSITAPTTPSGNITVTPSGGSPPYILDILKDASVLVQPTVTGPYTLSNLDAGVYTIGVKDINGCTGTTQTLTLKKKPILNVGINPINTANGYNINCFNGLTGITVNTSYTTSTNSLPATGNNIKYYVDGVLKATVFGPSSNVSLTNINAGNHVLTAVDSTAPSCSASTTFTLTQPPALSFVGTPNIAIIDGVTGCTPVCTTPGYSGPCRQAVVNVTGGVPPYNVTWRMNGTVLWGTGIISNRFCRVNPYVSLVVTVVDGNGCTITSFINV